MATAERRLGDGEVLSRVLRSPVGLAALERFLEERGSGQARLPAFWRDCALYVPPSPPPGAHSGG